MYCKKCGNVLSKNSTFCSSCGAETEDTKVKNRKTINDFFTFKKMLGHTFIRIIYIAGLAGITIGSIIFIILGFAGSGFVAGLGWISALSGLLMLVFGNILWRIACEVLIIFFGIHDKLGSIETIKKQ